MCGIAGVVRLAGEEPLPPGILRRMADAVVHRGPDDEGYVERNGVGLACRRLSIVGLEDGHQPIGNEDGSVTVVFNGELFDYRDVKRRLEGHGHRFVTHCDTEVIPHLWEDHQERMFDHMRGQFALALHDQRRSQVILARDRFGICPLYWSRLKTQHSEWLLFGSEIRSLLASGLLRVQPDPRGIDQIFHFFAVPGPSTCFADVQSLQPGHYLAIDLRAGTVRDSAYWTMDFPPRGDEDAIGDSQRVVEQFERILGSAVERRLRADVPVVSYVSGGIDSSIIAAMAARIRGAPTPAFTARVDSSGFDESTEAALVARHVGANLTVVQVTPADVVHAYPELIHAAEAPVIDTAAAATLALAKEVHRQGFKAALAGEGSDEWFAGYPWHKVHRLVDVADAVPGIRLSGAVRRLMCKVVGVPEPGTRAILSVERVLGHHSAFHYVYGLMTAARFLFFNREMLSRLEGHNPYLALNPDLERMRRWHTFNQSAYWAARIHLPGHLLSLKGDRPGMHSSVETRYPFLDEEVFAFAATLHPRWKMRGFTDKYIVRLLAERYLPRQIAWRPKMMFRAPLDSFFSAGAEVARFVPQLLSEDSLRRSGWFDVEQVRTWHLRLRDGRVPRAQKTMVHLGMVGVLTSQLWFHTFIEPLADLPVAEDSAAHRRRHHPHREAAIAGRTTSRA